MELETYCENIYIEQWSAVEQYHILKVTMTNPSIENILDEIGVDRVMSHFNLKPEYNKEDLI